MKLRFASAALAAACLSTLAAAQMGPGGMGGPGMGPGMHHGPGSMAGSPDCPMGQGAGPGGGGPGRHGMGHRGMGGMGGMGQMGMGGMGSGFPPGALAALKLSDEQRTKITEIRRDGQRKRHALMGSMREVHWKVQDAARGAEFDEAAVRKNYEAMAAVRKEIFESGLETRKRIEAVLTPEQRTELRKSRPRP